MTETLPIARYQVDIRLTDELLLQEYAGSMLRGGLGHALKRSACVTRASTCEGCPLRAGCAYSLVFEPAPPAEPALRRFATAPVPYTIEPMAWGSRRLPSGSMFSFRMVLIGPAIDALSMIILAWQRAWQQGFGKTRARGLVETLQWQTPEGDWMPVFSQADPIIKAHDAHLPLAAQSVPNEVRLTLSTPMRLEVKKRPAGPELFTAELLAANLRRRARLFQQFFFPEASFVPDTDSVQAMTEGVTLNADLGWRDWTRYSNRQQRKMNLGGVVGRVELSGNLTKLWPYLVLGEWLHVGAKTSFGFGRYQLEGVA